MTAVAVAAIPGAARAARELNRLRERVYAGDAGYRAPADETVRAELARPRFEAAFLAAGPPERPEAFVAARVSPDLRDDAGRPVGLLGPFEALDRPETTAALLREAARGLRAKGAGQILGPISADTWHAYRVNVGPWDDPPFLLEPRNPPYAAALWENAGFVPFEGYHTKRVDDVAPVAELLGGKIEAAAARGYRFVPYRPERHDEELDRIYAISRVVFADNRLYTEIPRDEFRDLYRGARALIDPECVVFAVDPDGRDAGFVFALPDPTGAVNVKTLGVLPEHRRAGLGGALTGLAYRVAVARGLAVNLCLMHDDNVSSRLDGGRSRVLRRYVLYRLADDERSAS